MTRTKPHRPITVQVAKVNNEKEFSRFFNNMVQNMIDMDNAQRHHANKKVSKKLDLANRRIAELQRENERLRKEIAEHNNANLEFQEFFADLFDLFNKYMLKKKEE